MLLFRGLWTGLELGKPIPNRFPATARSNMFRIFMTNTQNKLFKNEATSTKSPPPASSHSACRALQDEIAMSRVLAHEKLPKQLADYRSRVCMAPEWRARSIRILCIKYLSRFVFFFTFKFLSGDLGDFGVHGARMGSTF